MGQKPNKLLQLIWPRVKPSGGFLDLGCGQGRDSLFAAKYGFKVTAVDQSKININKIKQYLKQNNHLKDAIELFCEDIKDFNIEKDRYQIINAFNSLQFLEKNEALAIIQKMKEALKKDSFVIIAGFTKDDPLYQIPANQHRCFFEPGELKRLFSDFEIILYEEKLIDDHGHVGYEEPHQHGVVRLVAQKN